MSKGTWADFATGDKGGDLIDLVRYIDGGTDVEACKKLADLLNVSAGSATTKSAPAKSATPEWIAIQPIPAEAMNKCPTKHRQHGVPSKVWIYRDAQGQPVMALYRFDLSPDEDGKWRAFGSTWRPLKRRWKVPRLSSKGVNGPCRMKSTITKDASTREVLRSAT
ncbi:hypothetical protein HDC32_004738 [Pseudomonas sp. JAI120]|nr:hypothetical protein [Pseudomonas sp. JAI120]